MEERCESKKEDRNKKKKQTGEGHICVFVLMLNKFYPLIYTDMLTHTVTH